MRILWLSHLMPYPPKGGVLQRSYHLLHELSKYHEVDLIAFNQPNLLKPMFNTPEEGLAIAKRELGRFCNNLDVFEIPSTSSTYGNITLALKSLLTKDPYNINWLKSLEYERCVEKYVQNTNYDLVHFDTISLVPYFDKIHNIPSILDHHNIESDMLIQRAKKANNLLKKIYFYQEGRRLEKYEKEFCPRFSLNITCSDLDTTRLQQISPDSQITTIPNGVDIQQFVPLNEDKESSTTKRIIFIGRLNWYPNAEAVSFLAKEIWPKLKNKIPNIECDIIGASPPQIAVDLAQKDANFRVHGFVDDIAPFMSQHSVYVCPITNGGGTKLKVLDALAMAMPLVATPFTCEGINVTNNKNVIFAETGAEFSDAIIQLLKDEEKMKTLGANGRKLIVEQYSYTSIGQLFTKHCNSIKHHD